MITNVIYDPDHQHLISCSKDKSIRIWSLPPKKSAGQLYSTLRGYRGEGAVGGINAMALFPGGRWLAAGGYLAKPDPADAVSYWELGAIRIYDLEKGELIGRMTEHRSEVDSIAIRRVGNRILLASGCGGSRIQDGAGVIDGSVVLWDVTDPERAVSAPVVLQKLKDHDNGDDRPDTVYSLAFSEDGKTLVTSSTSGDILVYRLDTSSEGTPHYTLTTRCHHEGGVRAIALSPDTRHIVSGGLDHRTLLWFGENYQNNLLVETDGNRMKNVVSAIAFSPDGRQFVATTRNREPVLNGFTAIYSISAGNPPSIKLITERVNETNLVSAVIWPKPDLIITSGGDDFALNGWNPTRPGDDLFSFKGVGHTIWGLGFQTSDAISPLTVGFSESATADLESIAPSLTRTFDFCYFCGGELTQGTQPGASPNPFFKRARHGTLRKITSTAGDYLTDGTNPPIITNDPREDGALRDFTVAQSGDIVVASSFSLKWYSSQGKLLASDENKGHEGEIWSLALSADEKYLVTGSDDQTIRLWSMEGGQLLVSLSIDDRGDYICWTPDGYFKSNTSEMELRVGWWVSTAYAQPGQFYKARRFYKYFENGNLIEECVAQRKTSREILGEERVSRDRNELQKLIIPSIDVAFLDPEPDHFAIGDPSLPRAVVRAKGSNPEHSSAGIELRLNGQELPAPDDPPLPPSSDGQQVLQSQYTDIPLCEGENQLEALAFFGKRWSSPVLKTVILDPKTPRILYVLGIGVERYLDARYNVEFCENDVLKIIEALKSRRISNQKVLFQRMETITLFNDQATTENVASAFIKLKDAASPNDVFILIFSGHGKHLDTYYLQPYEALSPSNGISGPRLAELLSGIKCYRKLLLVDACEAGWLMYSPGIQEEKRKGTGVIVAAAGDKKALSSRTEHLGLFSSVVFRGIGAGLADGVFHNLKDDSIVMDELCRYVRQELANSAQKGDGYIPPIALETPIALTSSHPQ